MASKKKNQFTVKTVTGKPIEEEWQKDSQKNETPKQAGPRKENVPVREEQTEEKRERVFSLPQNDIGSWARPTLQQAEKRFGQQKAVTWDEDRFKTNYEIMSENEYVSKNRGTDREFKYLDYVKDELQKRVTEKGMPRTDAWKADFEMVNQKIPKPQDQRRAFERNMQRFENLGGTDFTKTQDWNQVSSYKHLSPQSAKDRLISASEGGNVDLTARTVFDGGNIKSFGWDTNEGEAVTTLTSTYSNPAGTVAMNFTPIGKNSSGEYFVLTPDELRGYAEDVVMGRRQDTLGLKIGKTYEGADAVKQASDDAEYIHNLQDDYYLNGQVNQAINQFEASAGKGYPYKNDFSKYNFSEFITEEQKNEDSQSARRLSNQAKFISEMVTKQGGSQELADYFDNQASYFDSLDGQLENYMKQQRSIASNEEDFNEYLQKQQEDNKFYKDVDALANGKIGNRYSEYANSEDVWRANGGQGSYLQYVWDAMSKLANDLNTVAVTEGDLFIGEDYKRLLNSRRNLSEEMLKVAYALNKQKYGDTLTEESNKDLQEKLNLVNLTYIPKPTSKEQADVYVNMDLGVRSFEEAQAVDKIAEAFKYDTKYGNKDYKESTFGKFGANFADSWISIHANDMWNDYADTGNEKVMQAAQMLDNTQKKFEERNKDALEYDDWMPDIVSKNLPKQLPQTLEQVETAAPYALAGAGIGGATFGWAGAIKGGQAGYVAGSSIAGYEQMRGDAMRTLTEEYNLPYKEAVKLATNEGLISGAVEGVDTALSLLTWGVGKIPKMGALKETVSATVKGSLSNITTGTATKLGLSKATQKVLGVAGKTAIEAVGEGIEEFTQSGISASNKRIADRYLKGEDVQGFGQLIGEAFSFNNYTDEDWKQMLTEGWEGFKTGLVMAPVHGGTSAVTNATIKGFLNTKNDLEIGETILGVQAYNRVIVNGLMSGNKNVVSYAQRVMNDVESLGENEVIDKALVGRIGTLYRKTADSLMNQEDYKTSSLPTAEKYTDDTDVNNLLNGISVSEEAVERIVTDADLRSKFENISGLKFDSPSSNAKVNGAVKTVMEGKELSSKAVDDILGDNNAVTELERLLGYEITRTADKSTRQAIREAVEVVSEGYPAVLVREYSKNQALGNLSSALTNVGYTKAQADGIISSYNGDATPEAVNNAFRNLSAIEKEIYTNPAYGLARFSKAKKSPDVLKTVMNVLTNDEAVITEDSLKSFATAFTESAKNTKSRGYTEIENALKEKGFSGDAKDVAGLLYNIAFSNSFEYKGADFSGNRFAESFGNNLKLFAESTMAMAVQNNGAISPATMQVSLAIGNQMPWNNVLQLAVDYDIINSKGVDRNAGTLVYIL